MFFKKTDYELLKPFEEAKLLLRDIADGKGKVGGKQNPYRGTLNTGGFKALLKLKKAPFSFKVFDA